VHHRADELAGLDVAKVAMIPRLDIQLRVRALEMDVHSWHIARLAPF